jgi:hypothetical protein
MKIAVGIFDPLTFCLVAPPICDGDVTVCRSGTE